MKTTMHAKFRSLSILMLFALPGLLCAQQPDPLSVEVVKHGEEVYGKVCTFCHGEGGAGGSARRLGIRKE